MSNTVNRARTQLHSVGRDDTITPVNALLNNEGVQIDEVGREVHQRVLPNRDGHRDSRVELHLVPMVKICFKKIGGDEWR